MSTKYVTAALAILIALALALPGAASAAPALPMKAGWDAVRSEQNKELSGRYRAPHSGPISFRNTYCKRRSTRMIHCFYSTTFNGRDPGEFDWSGTIYGYACGHLVDVRLPVGRSMPIRTVRSDGCQVLRHGY